MSLRFRPYLIGITAFAAGWLIRLPLLPFIGTSYPYLPSYPVVLAAAWIAGARAGMTAAVLSALSVQALAPADTLFVSGQNIAAPVFLGTALIVSAFAEERRRIAARAEERERQRVAEERAELATQATRYREWLDTLVADVPAVVWEAWGEPDARAQRIDFVSRHVERMLGYRVEAWLSTPNFWLTIVHPDDRDRAGREAREIFEGRRGGTSRFRWVKRTGEAIWVEGKSTVILDRDGRPIGMRGVTVDISEVMRFEAERSELLQHTELARRDAEEANRLKDEFLMTLSHELRTPLNAIWGWTRMLRTGVDAQRLARGLEVIDRNAAVQLRLVEDLLDISSIMAGKLRIDMEPTDMESLVAAVAESAKPTADAKGVTLVTIPDGRVSLVRGDTGRLQQAVGNLVSNAVKFTPAGGSVTIATQERGGRLAVVVTDTGMGIEAAVLPLMFERFRQGDSGPARMHMGLGLGLAIARSLVEAHGGTLTAASDGIGRGATLTITLPVIAIGDPLSPLPGGAAILPADGPEAVQSDGRL